MKRNPVWSATLVLVLLPAFAEARAVPEPLCYTAGSANWGWAPEAIARTAPYNAVGAVVVDMRGEARGSGCAVLNHIVLTAGHMLVDERGNWATNVRWSRARTPATLGTTTPAQVAVDTTYRSRLQQGLSQEDRASFSMDWGYLAFYGADAGTTGAAPMMPGFLTSSPSGSFEIAGYPVGRYPNPADTRRDEMHSTNPGMTWAQFVRGPNYRYGGTTYTSDWFNSTGFYIWGGTSGGPLFGLVNGVKHVVGIAVSGSNQDTGCRELTASLHGTLVAANQAYQSWVSVPVASCRSGSPVKIHQGWNIAFTVGSDGRLQATFFNGTAWQTATLGGRVLDDTGVPFDVDTQRGILFYISGGDVWVAYPTASGWAHAVALDYGGSVPGTPVGVSSDPTRRVVGVQQSDGGRRLLYLSNWTSVATTLPAGRVLGNTMWGPMAWDYTAGGGIVGRFFYNGWRTIDLTAQLGGVLPGDGNPAATRDGKLAPLLGGLAYAGAGSTMQILYPSGNTWVRWGILSNVNPRTWVAADSRRNILYFGNTSGALTIATLGSTSWSRNETTFATTAGSAAGVIEAFGTLFHAQGTTLSVCSLF